MNKEMNDEVIILDELCKGTYTYRVYEDNSGGLHIAIYTEDENSALIRGICFDVQPCDIKDCIEDLEDFTNWDGIVLRSNKRNMDIGYEDSELFRTCNVIDETYVQLNHGLRRDINYSVMGAAGKEAYLG